MNDKELLNVLIDSYSDLQRIINADDPKKEAEYQLKLTKAKLDLMGIVTTELNPD